MKKIGLSILKVSHILLFMSLIISCKTFKGELLDRNDVNDAILIAINDFTHSNRLYKKNRVFKINHLDTIHKMKLDGQSWIPGEVYEGIKAVSIFPRPIENKLLITSQAIVGSYGKLPSKFIEIDDKLFFWWDDNSPLTKEALDIFSKYNLLQDDEGGVIQLPDFIIDESQKGVDYYFCRNNLSKYKKVITNIAIGFYDIPKLNCD